MQQPRTESACRGFADRWEGWQGSPDLYRHVSEMPADLVAARFWPVGGGQAGGLDGIRGGAECVRAHMSDGYALTGGSGSGDCRGNLDITGGVATDESTADLLGSA